MIRDKIVTFKMKSDTIVLHLIVLFALCLLKSGCSAQILNLREGEICPSSIGQDSEQVCMPFSSCLTARQGIKYNVRPKICSFKGATPIVCCPSTLNVITTTTTTESTTTTKKSRPNVSAKKQIAVEKCHEYSDLIHTRIKDPSLLSADASTSDSYTTVKDCFDVKPLIVGGEKADPKEFPHMALLGYGQKVDNKKWACGGSLISDKWILTAAHCKQLEKSFGPPDLARWARLGDLNYLKDTDVAEPKDYKIVEHVIHPKYKPPSLYNDIALFRLEKSVEFSAFIRPLCLNVDQSFKPATVIATGWGQTEFRGPVSSDLLKVAIQPVTGNTCFENYSGNIGAQLPNGINDELMICAGDPKGGKDACGGDSGGPLQTLHPNYTCMYTQIGITSFGKKCAEKNSPGVYARVSNYISWIEPIVWPKI